MTASETQEWWQSTSASVPTHIFVDAGAAQMLTCSICYELPRMPKRATCCGKPFCEECMSRAARATGDHAAPMRDRLV